MMEQNEHESHQKKEMVAGLERSVKDSQMLNVMLVQSRDQDRYTFKKTLDELDNKLMDLESK